MTSDVTSGARRIERATIDSFRRARQAGQAGLMIRHAAREAIETAATGADALLTDQGRADAHALGRALGELSIGDAPMLLFHPPALRGQQTAAGVAAGIEASGGRSEVRGPLTVLGGPFLYDPIRALELALQGGMRYVRRWFDDELPEGIVKSRRDTAVGQVEGLIEALSHNPGQHAIFVSHDWNMLAVREEFLGLRPEEAGWVEFLEGIAMGLQRGTVTLYCRGHQAVISVFSATDR